MYTVGKFITLKCDQEYNLSVRNLRAFAFEQLERFEEALADYNEVRRHSNPISFFPSASLRMAREGIHRIEAAQRAQSAQNEPVMHYRML